MEPRKKQKISSPAGFEPTRPKARPNFIAGPRVNHSTKVTVFSSLDLIRLIRYLIIYTLIFRKRTLIHRALFQRQGCHVLAAIVRGI